MNPIKFPPKKKWAELCRRPLIDNSTLNDSVISILNEVKTKGDDALFYYAEKFDKTTIKSLSIREKEIAEAQSNISPKLKKAIKIAYKNIYAFHLSQLEKVKIVETTKGVHCWRKSVAIETVGLYIPGGSAPLFSTLLMLGIPAKIAGCKNIVVCTPADKSGKIHPAILYTVNLLNINNIYKIGGAQAIAAMAYGTQSILKVDKIFGPGNQYVTCAKQLVNAQGVNIDMPAGPSEVAVIADSTCNPAFVAADLLSQAEHGADSQVLLLSNSLSVIKKVNEEISSQLELIPRKEIATKALSNSKAILLNTINECVELVNMYAPEHLIITCKNDELVARKITNAGSVFLGNWSCESAGDYASGTNHTLPTNAFAKSYSGVSVDSFVKKITFQKISKSGIKNLSDTIITMAEAEGLQAHSNAVKIRINTIN